MDMKELTSNIIPVGDYFIMTSNVLLELLEIQKTKSPNVIVNGCSQCGLIPQDVSRQTTC